jgi:D-alanine-D-alanine ligase
MKTKSQLTNRPTNNRQQNGTRRSTSAAPRRSASGLRRELEVLVLVDFETVSEDDPQFRLSCLPELSSMEHHIVGGLRNLKHHVRVLPFRGTAEEVVRRIRLEHPDVVFNLVEHIGGDRRLSPCIPALLGLLNIPYTGCSEIGISLSLDKAGSKRILSDCGLPVPDFFVVSPGEKARWRGFQTIVKPRFGGGSEGLSLNSVVDDENDLQRRARSIHRQFRQDAVCERFIFGRELSVGLLGNGQDVFALPVRETFFGRAAEGGPSFCTERVKASASYRNQWGITYGRAVLSKSIERRVKEFCVSAYRRLELTGYARIDLRFAESGQLFFLEANPNPDLSPRVFGLMSSWAGMSYEDLLGLILRLARERHGSAR